MPLNTVAHTPESPPDTPDAAAEPVIPLRHPWRMVAVAVGLLLMAMLVHALVTEKGFEWDVVFHYLFARPVLDGVVLTIGLTASAMGIGIVLGLILAVMRLSQNPVLNYFAQGYISIFRAVPSLVQMIFWFNMASLIPNLGLGIPFGPTFTQFSATSVFSPFIAATLGLGLSEAAYMAEIFRGGILSVPAGQFEAARSVGMRGFATLRYVVLPQAMRSVVPPTGNEVIGMLKYTSLASVISVTELLQSVTLIYDRTFQTVPLLIVAAIWYVVLTTILTIGQRRIEAHYGRGHNRNSTPAKRGLSSAMSRRRRGVAVP